ncbi:hypothetical protein IQ243_18375 [Nostocales cyanobacterium LEGE 11386]|nr:hypothetical protein [Nostocales cyanobacterium LEGE 11386]
MKSRLGREIIVLSTTLLLSVTSVVNAQTPFRRIRDSQILPYLLDNPNHNSWVRVRCVPSHEQELDKKRDIIRDRLLRPNVGDRNGTVTIEIEGSCRDVRIRVQDESDFLDYPVYNPYIDGNHDDFGDSWLTRPGSGWYWLLQRQR